MNYSSIQYFFWLISGSEISALKKCPNDYNRHANIGFMIFMTAFFALLTSYVAARTFVKIEGPNDPEASLKNWGMIGFALVWATLIFALDRSMVNSIKKDPTEDNSKALSKYLWPRLGLAVVLSLFMSIPLDHLIFDEEIKKQLNLNMKYEKAEQKKLIEGNSSIKQDSLVAVSADAILKRAEAVLNSTCNTPDCENAKSNMAKNKASHDNIQERINGLSREKRNLNQANYADYDSYQDDRRKIQDKIDELIGNTSYKEFRAARKNFDKAELDFRINAKQAKDKADSAFAKADSVKTRTIEDNKKEQTDADSFIDGAKGFATEFTTLFLMPDFGVQFLKWLLFFGLLIIEILPTYLKLKTPIGDYEWEIYYREQSHVNDIKTRLVTDQKILDANEKTRMSKEIELNDNILEKVASVELELANNSLDKWEKEVKSKTDGSQNKS